MGASIPHLIDEPFAGMGNADPATSDGDNADVPNDRSWYLVDIQLGKYAAGHGLRTRYLPEVTVRSNCAINLVVAVTARSEIGRSGPLHVCRKR